MRTPIETERLTIREFTLTDAPFIVRLLNTPGWLQFIGDRHVNSITDAEQYLLNGPMKSYAENGFGLYMVQLKDNTPIGMCGLIRRASLEHVDLGFALMPDFFKKGYTSEASAAILRLAKNDHQLDILAAITAKNNAPSVHTLKKLGFTLKELKVLEGESEESLVFELRL